MIREGSGEIHINFVVVAHILFRAEVQYWAIPSIQILLLP